MRISSQHFSNTMMAVLQGSNVQTATLMQKIASGERIQRASDDPIGTVRLMMLERDSAMLERYQKNIGTLSIRLQQNEAHLQGMLSEAMSINDILLRVADGSNTPADLNAMAGPMGALMENLAHAANAKDSEGNYLFSGTLTSTPALSYDAEAPAGSRYHFMGNLEQQNVVIGNGVTQTANIGVENLEDVLNQLDQVVEMIADPQVAMHDPANRALLERALQTMKTDGIGALASKISTLGGAQNTLGLMGENHASMVVANGQASTLIGELDFAQAVDELNRYLVSIEGTYQLYGKVSQLSLFDLL